MACGECGDPRELCRCSIQAADASVTISGNGEPGDPYLISAPGAGAGTRDHDRASVYANPDGSYPPKPPDYVKFDWFGPEDPAETNAPNQYDGWYSTAQDAPVSADYTFQVEAPVADGATFLTAILPVDIRVGDVGLISYSGPGPLLPAAPNGWILAGSASAAGSTTAVYLGALDPDSERNVILQPVNLPAAATVIVYRGVDKVMLDASVSTATALAATSLTIPSISLTGPALLVTVATLNKTSDVLVPPTGMSQIMATAGIAPRQVIASQSMGNLGPAGDRIWTHTPNSVPDNYSGVMLALRPGQTVTYNLWIDGQWVPVGGSGGGSGGSGGGGGTRDFVSTVGDGVASTFTVVHPLASLDVSVEVVNTTSGQTCWPVVVRPNQDSIYLDFGTTIPPAGSRRVLISRRG